MNEPKFSRGDKVSIEITYRNKLYTLNGEVRIVDRYGTFEQDEEPSYDIMIEHEDFGGKCLIKHCRESGVIKYE